MLHDIAFVKTGRLIELLDRIVFLVFYFIAQCSIVEIDRAMGFNCDLK